MLKIKNKLKPSWLFYYTIPITVLLLIIITRCYLIFNCVDHTTGFYIQPNFITHLFDYTVILIAMGGIIYSFFGSPENDNSSKIILSRWQNVTLGIVSLIVGLGGWFVYLTVSGKPWHIFGQELTLTTSELVTFLNYFIVPCIKVFSTRRFRSWCNISRYL